jgi:hypothetical protein
MKEPANPTRDMKGGKGKRYSREELMLVFPLEGMFSLGITCLITCLLQSSDKKGDQNEMRQKPERLWPGFHSATSNIYGFSKKWGSGGWHYSRDYAYSRRYLAVFRLGLSEEPLALAHLSLQVMIRN